MSKNYPEEAKTQFQKRNLSSSNPMFFNRSKTSMGLQCHNKETSDQTKKKWWIFSIACKIGRLNKKNKENHDTSSDTTNKESKIVDTQGMISSPATLLIKRDSEIINIEESVTSLFETLDREEIYEMIENDWKKNKNNFDIGLYKSNSCEFIRE
jgi:hypothetical protein